MYLVDAVSSCGGEMVMVRIQMDGALCTTLLASKSSDHILPKTINSLRLPVGGNSSKTSLIICCINAMLLLEWVSGDQNAVLMENDYKCHWP